MAASIRAFFRANIAKILDDLREHGIKQKDIANDFGVGPTAISQMKNGSYYPSPDQMDLLVEVLNKYSKVQIEYEDLVRDPAKAGRAMADLISELADRAGLSLVKKP